MPRKVPALLFLKSAVILFAGWFVFSPVLHGGWLWDDDVEISGNADLHDLAGLGRIWSAPVAQDYYPLKAMLQWVQWHLWHGHVAGYHLTNLGLHCLGALLFWRVLDRLGMRLAWLGGLFFVAHPLAVESVAWISELKNVLSLPLMLMAMLAWMKTEGGSRKAEVGSGGFGTKALPTSAFRLPPSSYLLSLGLFVAAMLCKSSVAMFPFVLLLYCWWRRGRISRADLLASIPFFAVSLVLGLVTTVFQADRVLHGEVVLAGGFFARVAVAGRALAFYAWKFVLPTGLLPIYRRWPAHPVPVAAFLPWLVLAALCAFSWRRRVTWGRHVLLGLGFFAINLAPVLGFVPMAFLRFAWVSDHLVYLPMLGLIGLAVAGLGRLEARASGMGGAALWTGAALAAGASALEARGHAKIFHDAKILWTTTLHENPDAWIASNNLGCELALEGKAAEAVILYERALGLFPNYPAAHYNEANALAGLGRSEEAIHHYEEAIRLDPNFAGACNNLANVLMEKGRAVEGLARYAQAARISPDVAQFRFNLAGALLRGRRFSDAVAEYSQALELSPSSALGHNNLGVAFLGLNRREAARAEFEQALRLAPDYADPKRNLGLIGVR